MDYGRAINHPHIAEHGVGFAVQHSEVGRTSRSGDQCYGLIPRPFRMLTQPITSLIPARNENHPLFYPGMRGCGTGLEESAVVVEG